MAEVSASQVSGNKSGSESRGGPQFKRNFFIDTPNTSQAKLDEKKVGRRIPERWRLRHNKEKEGPPEKISFKEDTRAEMTQFLDNWATNIHKALNKPGGDTILDVLPHAKNMAKILDIRTDEPLDDATLKKDIQAILNTPEGWVTAKALLDQEQALQAFAAGITHFGTADGQNRTMAEAIRQYADKEGFIHKYGRQAGQGLIKHWGVASAVGITGLGFIAGGPIGAGIGLGGAVLAKGGYETARRGRTTEIGRCAEALQLIQNNDGLKNYMKLVVRMDADDFAVQDGRVVRNPARANADMGTRVNMRNYVDGLLQNTLTRQHYYRDLHVPLSQQDAVPERFILSGTGLYERTGDRVHGDTLDIWQNLRRAVTQERRQRGPEIEADEATQRANLLRDRSGRGVDSPIQGRDYPAGVEPPPFDAREVLGENVDQWGQAPQRMDGVGLRTVISGPANLRIESNLYGTRDPLERQRSDWYGRAPAERVFFLGTEAVPFQSRMGEAPYQLTRVLDSHPTNPDASIHREDGSGRKVYEYEYRGTTRVELSADTAEQQIFYITDDGDRIPLTDPRITKTTNIAVAEYEFTDGGGTTLINPDDMFYIPTNQQEAPIPFSHLRSTPDASYTPGDPVGFVFEPRNGPFPPVQVAENKFYLVNPGATPSSMDNYPENPAFIEDFYRDSWFIPPAEGLTPYDRHGEAQAFLYGRDFPATRLAIMDRLVRNGVLDEGITTDELQRYIQGDPLPAERLAIIERIENIPRPGVRGLRARMRSMVGHRTAEQVAWDEQRRLRPLQEVDEANFRARDNAGRSPRDIRFGITDVDLVAALNTVPPADASAHLFAIEATGRDRWGQLPGDPFFCRADRQNFRYSDSTGTLRTVNLNEQINLDSIDIDSWGQRRTYDNGDPNPFFMIQDENEVATRESRNDLELWIKAREIALGNLSEDLIRRIRKVPTRNRSVIQAKRNARKEGGANLKRRIERAGRDKPIFEEARRTLKDRIDALDAHKKATDELTKARTELPTYLTSKFGTAFSGGTDLDNARATIAALEAVRDRDGTNITILGSAPIDSLYDRLTQLAIDQRQAENQVAADNPEPPNPTDKQYEAWETRVEREIARVQRRFDNLRQPIEQDRQIIQDAIDTLNKHIQTIETQEKALAAGGDLTKSRDAALGPQGEDIRPMQDLIHGPIPMDAWRTESITQLLTRINAEHIADPNFGWPATDNSDTETQKILLYTVAQGRLNARAIQAADAAEDALPVGSPPADVAAARQNAINGVYNNNTIREEVIRQLHKQMEREVRRIDNLETTAKEDPTLQAEDALLEVTDEAMGRQGTIFGLSAGFMSRVNEHLPLEGNDLQTVADLSTGEQEALRDTEIGLNIPDTMPVAILELYDVIFGWKGRSDQKVFLKKIVDSLPPDELVRVMQLNAPETIPPLREPTNEFLLDLHNRIGDLQTGLQVSRNALRRMFIGVLDHLENSSLALYDPAEVNIPKAAEIRKANLNH